MPLIAWSAVALMGCGSASTLTPPRRMTVAQENQRPGDASWNVPKAMWAPQSQLALWASPYSAHGRDTVDIFVHATKGPVTVSVYRLGWYGGLGARLVASEPSVAATAQSPCSAPFPGPVTCPWTRTMGIAVGADWMDGLYLIRVVDTSGMSGFYPFVLTAQRQTALTAVFPVFTWQAYNAFGGSSLYTPAPGGGLGHFVSFERPYGKAGGGGELLDDFASLDLRVVRFLERSGYDVGYASDLDLTGVLGSAPHPPHGLIFVGHDEYWTWAERDTVGRLRDRHTHLMFLSANNAYWNVRLGPGTMTGRPAHAITCYKLTPDPGARTPEQMTTNFRRAPLNRPENGLYGVMYAHHFVATAGLQPLVVSDTIGGSEATVFDSTAGLVAGDTVPDEVGIEGDEIVDNGQTPPGLQILFRTGIPRAATDSDGSLLPPFPPIRYYTSFFVAPGGAGVFAGGNLGFARRLDTFRQISGSPRIQALVASVLNWMLSH